MAKQPPDSSLASASHAESSASGSKHQLSNSSGHLTNGTGSKKRDFTQVNGNVNAEAGPSTPPVKRRHMNGKTNGALKHDGWKGKHASFPQLNGQGKANAEPTLSEQRRSLPIWSAKDALVREIRENDAVVILGETGSGKTTQIPQFIHEAGLCPDPLMIAITQPRKVAATSLAARVSAEQQKPLGSLVGYSVRFDERSSGDTRIKYMTDGMLGRELLTDPMLTRYGVIVVDEAHERTLRTDMLLTALKGILVARNAPPAEMSIIDLKEEEGLSKKERKRRAKERAAAGRTLPPLKVIIMSATLDAQRFSQFFNSAKILYVKGRQHPVVVLHTAEAQEDYIEASLQTFYQIHTERPPGDVLIFLPGQEDIDSLASSIESLSDQITADQMQVLVCPMYAALPPAMQRRVFGKTPPNTRKVVLATNIAETSITIPGVKYVVDTGLCKEKRYFARGKGNGVEALLTQPISKSSALQRTGRAGREGQGWCFRLYTEDGYATFRDAAIPEIQRCNLTLACLQMKCLGQNPETADFMDAPSPETIQSSMMILYSLNALDEKGQIAKMGRRMARFPLDPAQSRSLLESVKFGHVSSVISVLSLLSTSGKIYYDPKDRETAHEVRLRFRHRSGDHMTLLNVLRAYEDVLGQSQTAATANGHKPSQKSVQMDAEGKSRIVNHKGAQEWCRAHFLNERALKEGLDIRKQLQECCDREKMGWKMSQTTSPGKNEGENEEEGVLRSLLAGLWQNTALITPDGSYKQVVGNQPVKIHPSSSLFGKKCPAIMYDELVFTSNTYAMGVSSIPQTWIAEVPFFARSRQTFASSVVSR